MKLVVIIVGYVMIFLVGCTKCPPTNTTFEQSLGQFTIASTHIVNNLNFKQKDTIKFRVKGEACIEVDPDTLEYISGPKDNRIQRAMDNAINKGNDQGFEGDILINVRIENKTFNVSPEKKVRLFSKPKRMECVVVSGELVSLSKGSGAP